MSSCTGAAVTECHRLAGLNSKHFFLMVLEAENSEIKAPVDSVSAEMLLPGSRTAVFLLFSHMVDDEGNSMESLF